MTNIKGLGELTGSHVCTKFFLLFRLAIAETLFKQLAICTPSDSVGQLVLGRNNGPCVLSWLHMWRSHVCCAIYKKACRIIDIIIIFILFRITLFSNSLNLTKKNQIFVIKFVKEGKDN